MSYCTVNFIRKVSGLGTSKINDADLRDLRDDVATAELNEDINYYIEDEVVKSISSEKDNDLNSSNKTFYLKETHESRKQVGDYNNDGAVNDSDIDAYYILNDTRYTNLSVTLQDADIGKLNIEKTNGDALPGNAVLYLSYATAPVDEETPHNLIKLACAQLTAAYAFTNIEASKLKNYKIGKVTIRKQSDGFNILYNQYQNTINKISSGDLIQTSENENTIEDVF